MGLAEARAYAESHGHHVTIMVGVVAEHDSQMADELLVELMAAVMSLPDMPLMPNAISEDCLIAPPERGNLHVEVRWISV